MKEELEKLVAAGKIGRPHVEPLLQLVQSGFAMHRSWGFGKVKAVDTVFARLTIDFPNKPGHSMDLGFAAELLKNLSDLTDKSMAVTEEINMLNIEIATHQRTQPALALEAIFVRDELR